MTINAYTVINPKMARQGTNMEIISNESELIKPSRRPERNSKMKSTVIDLSHQEQYLNYQEWLEHQTLTILLQSHLAHQEQ